MTDLNTLIKERTELAHKIQLLDKQTKEAAINQVRGIISAFGLEPYDLFDEISIKVTPKYKNPVTGELWSGRGKTPRWLVGKDRSQFEINKV